MRVAVTQFATTSNVQKNLATCISMIKQAAACNPDLIVLPHLCNSRFSDDVIVQLAGAKLTMSQTQSSYQCHDDAWAQAVEPNSEFITEISKAAIYYQCYLVVNVSLRARGMRTSQDGAVRSKISLTTCLFSPSGECIHQQDKQILTEEEQAYFVVNNALGKTANNAAVFSIIDMPVIDTPFGKIGFLSGNESESFAQSRVLAEKGAQLIVQTLQTHGLDQSALFAPARAAENHVYFVQANKTGALFAPEQQTEITNKYDIPEQHLQFTGQSQILAPDGAALAKLATNQTGTCYADIELAMAGFAEKKHTNESKVLEQINEELYQVTNNAQASNLSNLPETTNVAIFATYKANEQAIEDVCHYIENNLSDITQLPELFFTPDKSLSLVPEQRANIERLSHFFIEKITAVLRPYQYVCTSLVINDAHQAVILSKQGIIAAQQQLHFCQRYHWTVLTEELTIVPLELEQGVINVALLTADDALMPELLQTAAVKGANVLLVPFDLQSANDVENILLASAAEHKLAVVAASREKSFNAASDYCEQVAIAKQQKTKSIKSTGFIANIADKATVLNQWKSRRFDGFLCRPIVKHQHGKITKAIIHPKRTS